MSDTLTIPTTGDELEELLTDNGKLEKIVAGGQLTELVTAYARAVNDKDEGIKQQIKDTATAVLADMLRENGTELPVSLDAKTVVASVANPAERRFYLDNPKAMGAKLDGQFDSISDFLTTVWHGNSENPELQAKRTEIRNAFESDVPAAGGFLVPEEVRSQLLRVELENSVVRPLATTIPMGSSKVSLPIIDTTTNATTNFGGITTSWTEEAATLSASEPTFGRVTLDAKKLTSYAVVPNELISDSPISLEALISDLFPKAMAFEADKGFISGSGAGEPQGFTNAAAQIQVTKETGQAATTIVWENIVKMYARMLPGSLGSAVWVANINTFPELATMALSVGTGGSAIWLNNGSEGPPMTILGRPVIFTEKVPTLGAASDISFVDLTYYLIGDRQAMSVSSSEHVNFASDSTAFRIISRLDGRPWINSAITPVAGSTLSPFVTVAVRS